MKRLWITRSEPNASRLAKQLDGHDVSCLLHPLVSIELINSQPVIDRCDLLVVLSSNAVRGVNLNLVRFRHAIAIGATTQESLRRAGIDATVPQLSNSEGLLRHIVATGTKDSVVLIVCGEGGRKLLRNRLINQKYQVFEWFVYRRHQGSIFPIEDLSDGDFVELASMEALSAFYRATESQLPPRTTEYTLIVPSQRIFDRCRTLGVQRVKLASGPNSGALIDSIYADL